jgi:hypothetical protein
MVAALSMAGDATTLPLRGTPASERRIGPRGWLSRRDAGELARASSGVRVGVAAIASIVVLSLFLVLMAADRPSLLTPTTHTGFFPRWMAGPLGGLMPWFTNDGKTLKALFTAAVVVMYVGYVVAVKHAPRLPARWIVGAILAVHAIFLLSPPLALTDVFNYINYGRMEVVHNLNPYATLPVLEPHNDPSYILSNWHELLSPYGPLFTLVTFAVVPLGVAGSFWALKGILMLASLATILMVWKCARMLGRDPRPAIVLAGLNPVVLVWGLGGDHNDFLMVVFIVLAFYLLLLARTRTRGETGMLGEAGARGEAGESSVRPARLAGWLLPLSALEMGAGAALVAAVAVKASGAILIPVVLAGLVRVPRTLVQVLLGIVVGGVAMGVASVLAFGVHIPDLSSQSNLVASLSVPNLIGLAAGAGGESAALRDGIDGVLVISVLGCCWLAWSRRWATGAARDAAGGAVERTIAASGWASVALLLGLSWVLPWYVLWVLPLAAVSKSRRLRSTALAIGAYLIVAWAPVSGSLWSTLGFHPERTTLGRQHQRYVKERLD